MCLTVGVRIVSIVRVACTRCLLGPPMSQLLCLMTQPRQPWRRLITWPVASVAGPPGMWEWLTNLLVGTKRQSIEMQHWNYNGTSHLFQFVEKVVVFVLDISRVCAFCSLQPVVDGKSLRLPILNGWVPASWPFYYHQLITCLLIMQTGFLTNMCFSKNTAAWKHKEVLQCLNIVLFLKYLYYFDRLTS